MKFSDLTPEMQDKAKACKTPDEVLAQAKEEGYELSDEELEQIAGGAWGQAKCPNCGSTDIYRKDDIYEQYELICHSCGYQWNS